MARQEFIADMEAKLREFETKLSRMAERSRPTDDQARLECEKKYHYLRTRRDELRDQLRQAAAAPDDAWQKFKVSLEKVYEDMVRYMDEVGNKIDGPEDAGLY